MINLDPPTFEREKRAFLISVISLIISLISIGLGIIWELIKRKGLLLGPLGLGLFLLGGAIVAEHILSKHALYSRLGYVHQLDLQTTLAEVIVWIIFLFLGIVLLMTSVLGLSATYIWTKFRSK